MEGCIFFNCSLHHSGCWESVRLSGVRFILFLTLTVGVKPQVKIRFLIRIFHKTIFFPEVYNYQILRFTLFLFISWNYVFSICYIFWCRCAGSLKHICAASRIVERTTICLLHSRSQKFSSFHLSSYGLNIWVDSFDSLFRWAFPNSKQSEAPSLSTQSIIRR